MTTTTEEAFDGTPRPTPAIGKARLFPAASDVVDITSLIGTLANWPPSGISGGCDAASAASGAAMAPASSEPASTAAIPIREIIRNAREPGSPSTPALKTRLPGVLSLRDGRQTTSRRGAHPQGGQAVTLRNMRKGSIPATHESVKTRQIAKLTVRQRRLHFGAISAIMAP